MQARPSLEPPCLSEDQVLALASGGLGQAGLAEAERHLDACDGCRMLVAAYAGARAADSNPSRGDLRMFKPGEVLAERYAVVRLIGEGGMGEVYEVVDKVVGEKVALKTLGVRVGLGEEGIAHCLAEMQLARRVTHKNVCRVFDVAIHSERVRPGSEATVTLPLLTMELLGGESLRARLVREGRLPPRQALELVAQMAAALDAAHAAGVVHLDFKCDNVMLVPEPGGALRVVVTDFGLARRYEGRSLHGLSSARIVGGTVGYMAPEQLEGRRAGPEADIWALGVVIFEMLTGRRPYEGATPLEVALRATKAQPPSLGSRAPRSWEAVIHRCLRPQPGERYRRASEVLAGLQAPQSGRRRGALLVAGVGAAAIAAGAALWLSAAPAPPPPAPVSAQTAPAPAPSPPPPPPVVAAPAPAPEPPLPAARPEGASAASHRRPARAKLASSVRGRADRAGPQPAPASTLAPAPPPPPAKATPAHEPGDDDAIDPYAH